MLAEDDPARTGSMVATGAGVRAVFDAAAKRGSSRLERPPVLQGRYRIIRTIGEGGMGTVYEAEQATPRRLVALKALRVGSSDADDALRRFALEAEVLARLQHPGIAQIHEAGFGDEVGEGPAWISMELVRGKPLVVAANERGLDRSSRLRLFLQVCDAVAFAHRRGVIHRDLKPSNILLAEPDADASGDAALGRPKVLDFGVARVLGEAWDAATILTSPGQLVGTLSYMSPEQVSGDPDAVDVRTDVYALGVILYELLTGKRPYDVRGKGLAEAITTLRETDPPLLSSIDPSLRGDLDAIARKALAKEPRRRYQSVADLAADLERHLRGEAVAARADASLYVLMRQARRHRWPLSLIGVIVFAVIALAVRSMIEAERLTKLAFAESQATRLAEATGRALAAELDASQLEQARLLARGGSVASAEEVLRRRTGESVRSGPDVPLIWARREIAARHPRMVDWQPHDLEVTSIGFAPSMDLVVSCAADGCVAVSDLDGQLLRRIDLASPGWWVTVDETNDIAYVGTVAGTLHALTLPWLEHLTDLPPLPRRIRDIATFNNDAAHLVAYSSESGDVLVVDTVTGTSQAIAAKPMASRLDFIDSKRLLIGRSDGVVMTADIASGQLRFLGRHFIGGVSALHVDQVSLRGYSVGDERLVRIWDLERGMEIDSFDAMNGKPPALTVDGRDGSVLVSGWWTIDRWTAGSHFRERIGSLPTGNFTTHFCPERNLAISGHAEGILRTWSLDRLSGGVPGPQLSGRSACMFAPDGVRLALGDGFGTTRIIDARTGDTLATPPQHLDRVKALAFSSDGQYFASGGDDGKLWLSNASDGAPRGLFYGVDPTSALSVSFSPDGRRLAIIGRDRTAKLLEVPSLSVLASLPLGSLQGISVNWSPDSQRLATTARDHHIRLWSVEGDPIVSRSAGLVTPWSVEFSPDGSTLAVGSWGRYVELRDARSLEVIAQLNGAVALVTRAGWVPTAPGAAPLVFASAADGSVRVWDVTSRRVLFEFDPFPSSDITGCSMSPDGMRMAVAGAWGESVIWDLRRWDHWSQRTLSRIGPQPDSRGESSELEPR
jgi:WD40 repeat protein/tRNA A-37 threonylcarbamoyl transferase component Bud32